jgi:transposase/CheY-like chemotaxis protein
MKKRNDLKVVFKTYDQSQALLLPPSLEELIEKDHPVRIVSRVIDAINLQPLLSKYKPGGTSSFHPRMLLKVLVYAYINNLYSSRRIEQALKENIHFMWLSGMNTPDHNTINRFRGERLKDALEKIFTEVVLLLSEEGLLSLKELYTDGTKMEASANRYTFVWGKSIESSRERIKKQLTELWQYAARVAQTELNDDHDPSGFDKVDAQKVEQTIEHINEALKDKAVSKGVKQKLNYAKTNWPKNLRKYDEQQKILGGGRSSFSKTDPDATFMRLKEDHMKNGQLKPAYNLQLSSNNQIVTTYSVHQSATDTTTLISHLSQHEQCFGEKPQTVIADAGYGSEQNLQWLEDQGIEAYVKHPLFDRQQKQTLRQKTPFCQDQLFYNQDRDCYYCPMGQQMKRVATKNKKNTQGFQQLIHVYEAQRCEGCPLRGVCNKGKGNRRIEVNHNLNRLKQKADQLLKSEEGIKRRKKRCWDIEPVFSSIKQNHHFRRFLLRGKEKVTVEVGLLALAHNLRKKAA